MRKKIKILLGAIILIGLCIGLIWYFCWRKKIPYIPLTREQVKNMYNDKFEALPSLCYQNSQRCKGPAGSHICCINNLVDMLEDLNKELGSKIFIIDGTLLAWQRYNGKHMIPHDDDLDTAMLAEHEVFLKNAIPNLEKKGYVISLNDVSNQGSGSQPNRSSATNLKIKYPPARYYDIKYSKHNKLHMDIALLTNATLVDNTPVLVDAPQKWANTLSSKSMTEIEKYKAWIMPRNMILPVKKTKYIGVNTWIPNKVKELLHYKYGPNYMIPYNRDGHEEKLISKKLFGRYLNKLNKENKYSNKDIGIGPILITNLPSKKERLHHLLVQCREENLYAMRGGNCCTEDLTNSQKKRFIYNKLIKRHLEEKEQKCFKSHEMSWEKAALENLPSLIVEDDASFPFNFKFILSRIMKDLSRLVEKGKISSSTVIRLGSTITDTGKPNKKDQPDYLKNTCFLVNSFNCGTWAYITTPDAAKLLLKISKQGKLQWPVDHFINPPYDRSSYKNYEKRLPSHDKYTFLEINPEFFKPLKHRYNLKIDKERNLIIQELSTPFHDSTTGGVALMGSEK